MNVGIDRKKALEQALANAKSDGKPRYLHKYNDVYWLEKDPPRPGPLSGSAGSDHLVVYPHGSYDAYDPIIGPPAYDRTVELPVPGIPTCAQELVRKTVIENGSLWSRDKILLKMGEENGEVYQAFRKKDRTEQFVEIGDLAFALLCLCTLEKFDFELAVRVACEKHVRYVQSGGE